MKTNKKCLAHTCLFGIVGLASLFLFSPARAESDAAACEVWSCSAPQDPGYQFRSVGSYFLVRTGPGHPWKLTQTLRVPLGGPIPNPEPLLSCACVREITPSEPEALKAAVLEASEKAWLKVLDDMKKRDADVCKLLAAERQKTDELIAAIRNERAPTPAAKDPKKDSKTKAKDGGQ